MKTEIKLAKKEQKIVNAEISKIKWLNINAVKETFADVTEDAAAEILQKQKNLMICNAIISMYIKDEEVKEQFADIINEILAEID
jgi:hypothetical protein